MTKATWNPERFLTWYRKTVDPDGLNDRQLSAVKTWLEWRPPVIGNPVLLRFIQAIEPAKEKRGPLDCDLDTRKLLSGDLFFLLTAFTEILQGSDPVEALRVKRRRKPSMEAAINRREAILAAELLRRRRPDLSIETITDKVAEAFAYESGYTIRNFLYEKQYTNDREVFCRAALHWLEKQADGEVTG